MLEDITYSAERVVFCIFESPMANSSVKEEGFLFEHSILTALAYFDMNNKSPEY